LWTISFAFAARNYIGEFMDHGPLLALRELAQLRCLLLWVLLAGRDAL